MKELPEIIEAAYNIKPNRTKVPPASYWDIDNLLVNITGPSGSSWKGLSEDLKLFYKKNAGIWTSYENIVHLVPYFALDHRGITTEYRYSVEEAFLSITNLIKAMNKDQDIKLGMVGLAYLEKFAKAHPDRSAELINHIQSGRIELVDGAYTVPDHATNSIDDILLNYALGRRACLNTFSVYSTVMWASDQFGISPSIVSLSASMNYHEIISGHLPDVAVRSLHSGSQLLFNWKYGPSEKRYSKVYVPSLTNPLTTFSDFSYGKVMVPAETDILDTTFNLKSLAYSLIEAADELRLGHSVRHLMIPFGGETTATEFLLQSTYYENVLIFIKSNNLSGRYANASYFQVSTPSEYFAAVKVEEYLKHASRQSDTIKSVDSTDFYPMVQGNYAKNESAAFSGYFSTSPRLKRELVGFNNLLRGLKNVAAVRAMHSADLKLKFMDMASSITEAEQIAAMHTHHNLMTGACKQDLADHYIRRKDVKLRFFRLAWMPWLDLMIEAVKPADAARIASAYPVIEYPHDDYYARTWREMHVEEKMTVEKRSWDYRFLSPNQEIVNIDNNSSILVINQGIAGVKQFKVFSKFSSLTIIPSCLPSSTSLTTIKSTKISISSHSFKHIFSVPMLHYARCIFDVRVSDAGTTSDIETLADRQRQTSDNTSVTHDGGSLTMAVDDGGGVEIHAVTVTMARYPMAVPDTTSAMYDDNAFTLLPVVKSGKYIFTTTSQEPELLQPDSATYRVNSETGEVVAILDFKNEIYSLYFHYNPRAKQSDRFSTRFFSKSLPNSNLEICIRYHTNIKNDKTFYTDSNGLYAMKRTRDRFGPLHENNYYPMTRFAYVQGLTSRMTVMTDRASGCGSFSEGEISVIFNRRSPFGDSRFGFESNFENKSISISHTLHFETMMPDSLEYRRSQLDLENPPLMIAIDHLYSGMQFKLTPDASDLHKSTPGDAGMLKVVFDIIGNWFGVRIINMEDSHTRSIDVAKMIESYVAYKPKNIMQVPVDYIGTFLQQKSLSNVWPDEISLLENTKDQYLEDGEKIDFEPKQIRAFLF